MFCGVCWISDGISINAHQLTILLGKCKSSINGSLHRMKYVPFPSSNQASQELIEIIPILKSNFAELRQWTLRKQVVYTPQPHVEKCVEKALPEPTLLTPQPHFENTSFECFNAFDDDQTIQCDKINFFEDPFSIPLTEWKDEQDSSTYEQ